MRSVLNTMPASINAVENHISSGCLENVSVVIPRITSMARYVYIPARSLDLSSAFADSTSGGRYCSISGQNAPLCDKPKITLLFLIGGDPGICSEKPRKPLNFRNLTRHLLVWNGYSPSVRWVQEVDTASGSDSGIDRSGADMRRLSIRSQGGDRIDSQRFRIDMKRRRASEREPSRALQYTTFRPRRILGTRFLMAARCRSLSVSPAATINRHFAICSS